MYPPPPTFLPQTLLEAGADPHAVTLAGANALHFAHDVEGVRALLAVGVDVNARTRAGLSPLHALLLRDASDRALVLAGVCVDVWGWDGEGGWGKPRGAVKPLLPPPLLLLLLLLLLLAVQCAVNLNTVRSGNPATVPLSDWVPFAPC